MEKVSLAAALRILADAIEAEQAAASAPEPEWYDSKSYPFGERTFRRHVARGMKAVRAGKSYRVRRDDAEAYWATLQNRAPSHLRPADNDAVSQLERAGIRLVGGGR